MIVAKDNVGPFGLSRVDLGFWPDRNALYEMTEIQQIEANALLYAAGKRPCKHSPFRWQECNGSSPRFFSSSISSFLHCSGLHRSVCPIHRSGRKCDSVSECRGQLRFKRPLDSHRYQQSRHRTTPLHGKHYLYTVAGLFCVIRVVPSAVVDEFLLVNILK